MPKKVKYITAKEVAKLLKVSPEIITYLRQEENLPFIRDNKYILFSEPEIIRWRNRKLAKDSTIVMDLKQYWFTIKLYRFITYEDFKVKAEQILFLDGDNVIQYIKRQNPEKELVDLVGNIVYAYWDAQSPKCSICGRTIKTALVVDICSVCRDKQKERKTIDNEY